MEISKCAQEIKPSAIRKMFNKALEYDHVISFALGEPDFTASENIVDAGCRAIREGKTKYSANAGILELRKAISSIIQEEYDLSYSPENEITVTIGAMGALYLSLKTIINTGDEIIIFEPSWTNYVQQVLMCGGVPVTVPCSEENDFVVDLDDLRAAVTPRTKAILINSPCNPTGSVMDEETLRGIAELAKEHDLIILADEVYKKIVFDGTDYASIATIEGMRERTILINSFSKGYAMTGWRVGYAAGPEQFISNITKLQEDVAACVAMPSQYAALEALRGPQELCAQMVESYRQRRDYIVDAVNQIPGMSCRKPRGTFYVFINISGVGMPSEQFAYALLEKKHVVVVPGTAFGASGEGYIRMSCATSFENIKTGMELIREFTAGITACR